MQLQKSAVEYCTLPWQYMLSMAYISPVRESVQVWPRGVVCAKRFAVRSLDHKSVNFDSWKTIKAVLKCSQRELSEAALRTVGSRILENLEHEFGRVPSAAALGFRAVNCEPFDKRDVMAERSKALR